MRGKSWRPGRKTPKVKNGKVQKKHRWDYYAKEYSVPAGQSELPILWEPAIRRHRHLVTERDLRSFISIIPGWKKYSQGLCGIVLGDGDDDCYGWHDEGVICINAWSADIQEAWDEDFFLEHQEILDRLTVPYERDGDEYYCEFTPKTASAFLLTHVFLHELGHHYDRMQTKAQEHCPGGETFAKSFGNALADQVWPEFCRVFRF
tara:strand:- start:9997 stop:10611 length:615 start_codon:yes stop_codon:yes gene_type:complete